MLCPADYTCGKPCNLIGQVIRFGTYHVSELTKSRSKKVMKKVQVGRVLKWTSLKKINSELKCFKNVHFDGNL